MIFRRPAAEPALPVAVAFALGIAAAMGFNLSVSLAAGLICAGLCFIFRHGYSGMICLFFTLGALDLNISRIRPEMSGDEQVYEVSIETVTEMPASLLVKGKVCAAGQSPGSLKKCRPTKVTLLLPHPVPPVRGGELITARCEFSPVTPVYYLPYEYDPVEKDIASGYFYSAMVNEGRIISIAPDKSISGRLNALREKCIDILSASNLSAQSKIFIATALIGSHEWDDKQMRENLSHTGLAHILALSGLHVSIIAMMILLLLAPLALVTWRHIHRLTAIAVLWIFAVMTGLSPSVTRAVIMMTIMLGGDILERRSNTLNALCIAALVILIPSPQSLFSVSFQLSFASVAGIALFAEKLSPQRSQKAFSPTPFAHIKRVILSAIAVSMATMLCSGWLIAYHFNRLPTYFIVANIPVVPFLVPVIIAGGIVVIILNAAGIPSGIICDVVNRSVEILNSWAEHLSALPGAEIVTGKISLLTLLTALLLILSLRLVIREQRANRKLPVIIASAGLLLSVVSCSFEANRAPEGVTGEWYITANNSTTELVVNTPDTLAIVSTSRLNDHDKENIKRRATVRYRNYMHSRNIESVTVCDREARIPGLIVNNGVISTPLGSIMLLTDNLPGVVPTKDTKIDLAVICRGYRGNVVEMIKIWRPAKVALSPDLSTKMRERFTAECHKAGVIPLTGPINHLTSM